MLFNNWHDISSESLRNYHFPNGEIITLKKPKRLLITPRPDGTHSHRIEAEGGIGMYVPPGWLAITWKAKPGSQVFVL